MKRQKKSHPSKGLKDHGKLLLKILQQEGLLQYLLKPGNELNIDNSHQNKVLIGWTSQFDKILTTIPHFSKCKGVLSKGETLVIIYLDEIDKGM